MKTGLQIRIVLVDDHPLLRLGASNHISQSSDVALVAQLTDGKSLLDWLQSGGQADVVLLDRYLPDMDGLGLVNEIKARGLKLIMLSIADTEREVAEAISSGVDGYLVKTCEADQLIAAIRNVCEGQSSFPIGVMQRMAQGNFNQNELDCLTPRQLEIVGFVKRGMSNKAIAIKLNLSENTVRNHMRYIMEKLKARNRVDVAILGWKKDDKQC